MKVYLFFTGREKPRPYHVGLIDGEAITRLPYRRGEAIDLNDVESAIKLMSNLMDIDNVSMEMCDEKMD